MRPLSGRAPASPHYLRAGVARVGRGGERRLGILLGEELCEKKEEVGGEGRGRGEMRKRKRRKKFGEKGEGERERGQKGWMEGEKSKGEGKEGKRGGEESWRDKGEEKNKREKVTKKREE